MIKWKLICAFLFILFTNSKSQSLSISFSKNDKECSLGSAGIIINSSHSIVDILWSNNQTGSSIENLESGNYYVKVTDGSLKDTTIFFSIEELECLPIPENHFTPNGDSFNDTWDIGKITNYPNFDLYVYNRWGQMVHHQQNSFIPWDGKSIGIPLPDATYYYIIYLSKSDKNKIVKGAVSILK